MENKKFHYSYVLLCQDSSLYGGYTTESGRRLTEYNSGTGTKYTRLIKRRPVIMIHIEKFETCSEAIRAEAAFKKLTCKQKEQYLKTFH